MLGMYKLVGIVSLVWDICSIAHLLIHTTHLLGTYVGMLKKRPMYNTLFALQLQAARFPPPLYL